jgi:hypothetical protein
MLKDTGGRKMDRDFGYALIPFSLIITSRL